MGWPRIIEVRAATAASGLQTMKDFKRKEIQEKVKPQLAYAVRRGNYELFKAVLTSAGIEPGSALYRSLESKFWQSVAEHRRITEQSR
jgi:hypothetical protein